jgi:hypothetical protein
MHQHHRVFRPALLESRKNTQLPGRRSKMMVDVVRLTRRCDPPFETPRIIWTNLLLVIIVHRLILVLQELDRRRPEGRNQV